MSSTLPPEGAPEGAQQGNRLPPTMPETPPPVYNGRYELNRQIGRGGTAQVYLARDLLLDRPVALKMLFPELSSDRSFVERFRREAQAAANLAHPNIVPVFDWGEADRTYYIVMEYVGGEPLSAVIRTQAPLVPKRAAAIAADIAKALSYAHRHGVVHRDVKPGNVLMTLDGQVKVTDFGIARAIGQSESVTQTGLVMGTATYFSPEQAQGLGVDGRSDVYALGVVLYEMVTGRPPFMADTPVAIAYKHVSEAPPLPSEIEPRVPRDLEAIIMQAMAKQPQDRYVTAQDFNDDLERFMRDQPVLARSVHGASPGEPTIAIPASTTMIMSAPGGAAAATTVQKAVSAPKPASSKPDLPKRRFVPWLIAAVLLAAALVAIVYFGGRSLGYFGGATSFHPQDVVAKPYKSAEAILSRQGLKSAVKFEEGTAASKGLVERQSPEASSLVKKGDNVTLYVDAGPKKALLDYVVGQTLAQARKDLQAAHFNVRVAYKAPTSSTIAAGTVLNQNPKSGGYYPVGSTVTLTVAKGTANVTIPSKGVVGESLADARGVLRVAGFNVEVENYQFSSTYADGDVITTSPSPGSSEPQGSTVYLVVSKGPSSTVPNVLSPLMTQAQAIAAINSAGLTYKVIYVTTAGYEAGYVTSQSPSAGTPVTPNSVVTIYVEETAPTTTTSTTTSTTTTTTTAP